MLSPGGARGVEKAELNGNVDSDYNHGGSSRTCVLHRTGCSQEDDQLLHHDLALLYAREKEKGNANRATLAVARKMVAHLLAVDRGKRDLVPVEHGTSATA